MFTLESVHAARIVDVESYPVLVSIVRGVLVHRTYSYLVLMSLFLGFIGQSVNSVA